MIKLNVTQSRIKTTVTIRDAILLNSGDLECLCRVLGGFVTDNDGNYVSIPEGVSAIQSLTLGELEAIVPIFMSQMRDAAVPPVSATASGAL